MSDRSYLQHGRRHAPTGDDPIPGLSTAEVADLYLFGHTITVAGSGGTGKCAWYEFDTTSTSVFGTVTGSGSTPHNTAGDTGLLLMADGVYISFAKAEWDNPSPNCVSFISVARGNDILNSGSLTAIEALATNAFASTRLWGSSFNVVTNSGGTSLLNLNLENFDTVSHNVTNAVMSCVYLPTGALSSVF